MLTSQHDAVKVLREQEKTLPTAQLIERWQGRRDSALAWAAECQKEIDRLCGRSQLEMDVVVEPTTPPERRA